MHCLLFLCRNSLLMTEFRSCYNVFNKKQEKESAMDGLRYVLVQVIDREIYTSFYHSYEEAYDMMKRQFDEEMEECFSNYNPEYGEDYMMNGYSAYINGSYASIDWVIDEIH